MKKYIAHILIGLVAPIVLIPVLFLGYLHLDKIGILNSYSNYEFQKKLKDFSESEQYELDFKELIDFEWDRVCVFHPYGGNLDSIYEEGFWSLAFSSTENQEGKLKVNRGIIDLYPEINNGSCYSREVKILKVIMNNKIYVKFED